MSEEAEVSARSTQVNGLLQRKDKAGALAASLKNPPVNSKSEELKDSNLAIIEKVLAAISDSEIPALVSGLSLEDCDTLMKYVYKLMQRPKTSNCASLLKIHASLVEKAGLGSIVRMMTDRKTV